MLEYFSYATLFGISSAVLYFPVQTRIFLSNDDRTRGGATRVDVSGGGVAFVVSDAVVFSTDFSYVRLESEKYLVVIIERRAGVCTIDLLANERNMFLEDVFKF